MSIFQRTKYHISYFINAVNQHSLHAPFIYKLYNEVIKSDKLNGDFSEIESYRQSLSSNSKRIKTESLGADSKKRRSDSRTIKDIANGGLTTPKYSALLYRLIKYFNTRHIIELGTSLGVNTLYLAEYESAQVTTFEGNPELIKVAKKSFDQANANNIRLVEGNIDQTLITFLDGSIRPGLVYIDANHTYEATLRYFNIINRHKHDDTIVVIDDIKWSVPMQKAWQSILSHKDVTLSIDLNKCGIVFFKPDLSKQHYILTF